MKSIKEDTIQKFIMDIDFTSDDWSVNNIKQTIKNMIGEMPGIKINYKKDVLINEIKGEAQEYKKLNSIEIVFTDLDDKIKRVEYIIN
jgi:hypothetical protein